MAIPKIKFDQTGLNAGSFGASRTDGKRGTVTLTVNAPFGATVRWSVLSSPPGSVAQPADPTAVTTTFEADEDGSYLFDVVVNGVSAHVDRDVAGQRAKFAITPGACGYAVLFANGRRAPAFGETNQFSDQGWHQAMYDAVRSGLPTLLVKSGDDISGPAQDMINFLTQLGGQCNQFAIPSGSFVQSKTIDCGQLIAPGARGAGPQGTKITWVGDSTSPAWKFNRCQGAFLDDLGYDQSVAGATLLHSVVRYYNSITALTGDYVAPAQLSSRCGGSRVEIQGDGLLEIGIEIIDDPTRTNETFPGKNDNHVFREWLIRGYTDAACVLNGDQSVQNRFLNCTFNGQDTGLIGIDTTREHPSEANTGIRRPGSFHWDGYHCSQNQIASFYIARTINQITIEKCWIEKGQRLLKTLRPDEDTSALGRFPVRLVKCNFQAETGTPIPPDGRVVEYFGDGPFEVLGCWFGKAIDDNPFQVHAEAIATDIPVSFIMDGCEFSSSYTGSIFTGQLPEQMRGNHRHVSGGTTNRPGLISTRDGAAKRWWGVTAEDWQRKLGVVPLCWHRMHEHGPDPTFTTVDTAANDVVATAHGRTSGEGPVTLTPVGYDEDLVVTVNAAAGTYTRTGGSFLTAGFKIGQTVTWSGFASGGNNATKVINTVTATVMTVTSNAGLVNEGPTSAVTSVTTMPVGLARFTNYWLVATDADDLAFATTRAAALATTPLVDITSLGSAQINFSGSDGMVWDCARFKEHPPLHLMPSTIRTQLNTSPAATAPAYRQAYLAGFANPCLKFTTATIDQNLRYGDFDTESLTDPTLHKLAALTPFVLDALTAQNEYISTLGAGATGAGGGPHTKFGLAANGHLRGHVNGTTSADAGHNYLDAADHLLCETWTDANNDATFDFAIYTELETIAVGSATQAQVTGNAARGLGTGSGSGTLKTAGFRTPGRALFSGEDAEAIKLMAASGELFRRMGYL